MNITGTLTKQSVECFISVVIYLDKYTSVGQGYPPVGISVIKWSNINDNLALFAIDSKHRNGYHVLNRVINNGGNNNSLSNLMI